MISAWCPKCNVQVTILLAYRRAPKTVTCPNCKTEIKVDSKSNDEKGGEHGRR